MSSRKIGLAYLLGDSSDTRNHILPVNAMQYSNGKLYTGGRDGCIKVWQSGKEDKLHIIDGVDDEDADVNLLKLEASISSNTLPYTPPTNNFSLIDNYNIHFDWINDIKLVNDGHLVSCSSDLSMKIVDLDTGMVTRFGNNHTDYIRKLSYDSGTLISGGLDGRVNLWDLDTLQSTRSIYNTLDISTNLSSIYSLANCGDVIATGGPSQTINLFDKRAQTPFIRKLIGHSDNIRCLLMNEHYVLSGSSDSSIKLWDLRTFKVFKNFDIHDYPVWALASDCADFSTFYSGDRSGRIIKTDISYCSSSDHPPVPEFDTFSLADVSAVDEKIGISTIVADEDSPVLSLCVQGTSILSSNNNCFNQYIVPSTRDIAKYQYLRTGIDHLVNKDMEVELVQNDVQQDDLNSDFYDLISHLSMDTDLQSTFSNPMDTGTPPTETAEKFEMEEDYNSMFLDPNGGPSKEFINAYKNNPRGLLKDSTIDETPVEILLNPVSSKNISAVPFNLKPAAGFIIEPKSVVTKRVFNNKRQILALYLNGDIKMWDLLTCQEIRTWPGQSMHCLDAKQLEVRTKEMDNIFSKLQDDETLNNWCEVEIKAGKLFITLKETSFLNVEIYYDDMVRNYPSLSLDSPANAYLKEKKVRASVDDRYYLGAILLHSWFHEYSIYEWNYDVQMREEIKNSKKEDDRKFKYFKSKLSASVKSEVSSMVSLSSQNESDDSVMRLINTNRKYYESKHGGNSLLKVDVIDPAVRDLGKGEYLPYYPRIHAKLLPQNLKIMIFEYSPDLGNYRDVSSFLLGDLNNNTMINELRMKLPRWVGRPLLYNRYNPRDMPKIAFQLIECNYNELSPNKKIGGKANKKIKKLPVLESSIKLTSHNMLRVSKILTYLTDKFELKPSEMKNGKEASDWLVVECKGIELTKDMTLQTIKTKIWKSSSDIELYFRRKFDT